MVIVPRLAAETEHGDKLTLSESLAAELRQLAHADRSRPARDQRNAEALGEYLAVEGRKIADRLGIEISEMALAFVARQIAWTRIRPGSESQRLRAIWRRRNAAAGQRTF